MLPAMYVVQNVLPIIAPRSTGGMDGVGEVLLFDIRRKVGRCAAGGICSLQIHDIEMSR